VLFRSIKHTTPRTELKGFYLNKFLDLGAFETLNLFEDLRIDKIMCSSYEGAEDVFDSQIDLVKKIAEKYRQHSNQFTDNVSYSIRCGLSDTLEGEKLEEKNREEQKKYNENKDDNLFNYLAVMLLKSYKQDCGKLGNNLKERVKATEKCLKSVLSLESTQRVVTMLENQVYPWIKEYFTGKNLKDFPLSASSLKECIKNAGQLYRKETVNYRVESGTNDSIPLEWQEGSYDALKESVGSIIKELLKKLQLLKTDNLTVRYIKNRRSGRVNTKSLYKYRLDNFRVFKRKEETIDRAKSFAFSIVIDYSGSMY
jgi:hypothetical protein